MSQYGINLSEIMPIYQEVIDDLIEKLGKDVRLYYKKKPTQTQENYDALNMGVKKPSYKTGSDDPEYEVKTIRCIIKWYKRINPIDGSLEKSKSQCKIKTYMTNIPDIERADFIIPHDAYVNTRYKIASDTQLIGLGEDRYVIYYLDPILTQ